MWLLHRSVFIRYTVTQCWDQRYVGLETLSTNQSKLCSQRLTNKQKYSEVNLLFLELLRVTYEILFPKSAVDQSIRRLLWCSWTPNKSSVIS